MSEPALLVEGAGLASSLQDLGRHAYQRYGISESGALDAPALRLANALVGNPPGTAAIEITLSGPTLRVEGGGCRVALAGAPFAMEVNGRAAKGGRSLDLQHGDRLLIGKPSHGARAYLAVAGGFDVSPVLGSVSTHSRSKLGGLDGSCLKAGDRLPLARLSSPSAQHLLAPADPLPEGEPTLRVVLGPQDDHFTPEGIETFLANRYEVSSRADRMGYQLEGEPIEHRGGFNIVSDGVVNGSIQVPGNGRPIVLLADRQTTGGYPKIATVIEPDLPRLAQLRTGEGLRFRAVSQEEGEGEARAFRERCARIARSLTAVGGSARVPTVRDILAANLSAGIYRGPVPPGG